MSNANDYDYDSYEVKSLTVRLLIANGLKPRYRYCDTKHEATQMNTKDHTGKSKF